MSKNNNLQLMKQLFSVIHPKRLDEIAKETGFIQRKRNFTASDFIRLLFSLHGNLTDPSLQEICTKWIAKQGVTMSRAALDKKFTPQAVTFLQRVFQEIFILQQQLHFPALAAQKNWPFQKVRVIDSTSITIPDHQKKRAKKTGQQSVKIHFEFDILTGQITFITVDFRQINDAKMGTERIPSFKEGDLCLQDLGYMNFENLKKIEEHRAFFISKVRADGYLAFKNPMPRRHPNGDLVESSMYQKINVAAYSKGLLPDNYLEINKVYFGHKIHFPARCIFYCHDEAARQRQLKRIDKRASKSGKKPKEIVRDLAGKTIYMSNLPGSISAEQIGDLYRLRWQIELHFKVWKSYLGIHHFKLIKKERWLCHLYGTLLICLLSQLVAYQLRNRIWEDKEKEASEMILIRAIANEFLAPLYEGYMKSKKAFNKCIDTLSQLIVQTALKPKSTKGTAFKRLQLE